MPTDQLRPDQPDDSVTSILRATFATAYGRAMHDAAQIVKKYTNALPGVAGLEIRTELIEAGMQGGEVHDAILRTNEASARVAEQTAADNLAARTRMVTQGAPNVAEVGNG
jgi:hypothetical protein